jgi:hypothetical protein
MVGLCEKTSTAFADTRRSAKNQNRGPFRNSLNSDRCSSAKSVAHVFAITTQILKKKFFIACLSVVLSSVSVATGQNTPQTSWPYVPPVDFSKLRPSDFSDDELDIPFYLAHFHRVANSVVETGEDRGFINIAVWRGVQDNKPYNARIMENILSLAYFYSTKRPWNQYYASPAVRVRLQAALDFWCRIQSPEGKFSEYGPQRWNLAATAFATKFMGETLRLLEAGPAIDKTTLDRVIKADRRAIYFVLTDPDFHQHGKDFTNQFTNAWAGGLAYLSLYPDLELSRLLQRRIREDSRIFQSVAGYFYEARGPDFGYDLGTHHSNLWMSWHYARRTPLARILIEEERKFVEWLAYNAVREPDGSGYTLNRAIETRQRRPFLDAAGISRSLEEQGQRLLASEVVLARAFAPTVEEVRRNRREQRAALEKGWPPKSELAVGTFSTFSPYAFLHRPHVRWFATEAQRKVAIGLLPYFARQHFTHQRVDDRERVLFTFIRRPTYYATFNSGPHLTGQQRYGLGILWNPQFGTAIQSQTGSNNASWGTLLGQNQVPFEGDTLNAEFRNDARVITPQPGNRDLPTGVFSIKYGFPDQGEKVLTHKDHELVVDIQHSGALREQIPLLVSDNDELKIIPGGVTIKRGVYIFSIHFDPTVKAETIETELKVGQRRVVTLLLQSRNALTYTMSFGG